MARSPTGTFALSCVLLHDAHWLSALDQTIAFRRYLRDQFRIAPRAELKASWLIHNKGDIRSAGLRYPARLAAYRSAMRFQRKCGLFRSFTVLINKTKIQKPDMDVRELAWRMAIERLERFGTGAKDNMHVLPDEGHGEFIRKKIRAMRRFSHVPSAFGGPALDRKAQNIVEDSSDRRSHESYFIQLADLNAYAAFRRVFPGATFGADLYEELGDARVTEVNRLSGGPTGIVVWPK
ncbi:MAG: DUF3800 domain-containing protein [Xanthomonadales bacterium]|nr:DUF3800 domain-containing protein [Xanthomonadales bacterium]